MSNFRRVKNSHVFVTCVKNSFEFFTCVINTCEFFTRVTDSFECESQTNLSQVCITRHWGEPKRRVLFECTQKFLRRCDSKKNQRWPTAVMFFDGSDFLFGTCTTRH